MPVNTKVFSEYLDKQLNRAHATLPSHRLDLLKRLLDDALTKGRFPVAADAVGTLSIKDPRVQAIIAGEKVSVGGENVETKTSLADKFDTPAKKIAVMVVVFILMAGLAILLTNARSIVNAITGKGKTTPTALAFKTTMTPTLHPSVSPSAAVQIVYATPTPIAKESRKSYGTSGEPVSVEFGEKVYLLSKGSVDGQGLWSPKGPEWLDNTSLRRVVSIPWSEDIKSYWETIKKDIANKIIGDPEMTITIRLRENNGVIRFYASQALIVNQYQIEYLTGSTPSLVLIFLGGSEKNSSNSLRYIIVADAIQPTAIPVVPTSTPTSLPSETSATGQATLKISATPTISTR